MSKENAKLSVSSKNRLHLECNQKGVTVRDSDCDRSTSQTKEVSWVEITSKIGLFIINQK